MQPRAEASIPVRESDCVSCEDNSTATPAEPVTKPSHDHDERRDCSVLGHFVGYGIEPIRVSRG